MQQPKSLVMVDINFETDVFLFTHHQSLRYSLCRVVETNASPLALRAASCSDSRYLNANTAVKSQERCVY